MSNLTKPSATTNPTYKQLRDAVVAAGYRKVNEQPQEKLEPGEIFMVLGGMDLEFETADQEKTSYIVHPMVWFEWDLEDPDTIAGSIIDFISKMHQQLHYHPSFKFGKPDITPLGQYYRILVPCTWKQFVYTS